MESTSRVNTNQTVPSSNTAASSGRAWSGSTGFDLAPDKWWLSLLLGLLLIAGGAYLCLHAVAASIVTSILFGAILTVSGIFQIIHAFWESKWKHQTTLGPWGRNGHQVTVDRGTRIIPGSQAA